MKLNKIYSYTIYLLYIFFVSFLSVEAFFYIQKHYILGDTRAFYGKFHIVPDEAYWEEMLQNGASYTGYLTFDHQYGWAIRPNSNSRDGLFHSNSEGMRAPKEYTTYPDSNTFRIALFGDSFTHGDEVSYEESWGYLLEKNLQAAGVNAEVLNFGVGGFGMDQAYLRFLEEGKQKHPHLVVFGLQQENFWRNVNVFRPKYTLYSYLYFTKPKGILRGDSIQWVNRPTVPLDSIFPLIRNTYQPKAMEHEYFWKNRIYMKDAPFSNWLTVKFIRSFLFHQDNLYDEPKSASQEGMDLFEKIVESFHRETTAIGAQFVILQLPIDHEILKYQQTGTSLNEAFLAPFVAPYHYCQTEDLFLPYTIPETYQGHYKPLGNKLVGDYFSQWLLDRPELITRSDSLDKTHSLNLETDQKHPHYMLPKPQNEDRRRF